jgi:hypothetical protein
MNYPREAPHDARYDPAKAQNYQRKDQSRMTRSADLEDPEDQVYAGSTGFNTGGMPKLKEGGKGMGTHHSGLTSDRKFGFTTVLEI